MIRPYFYIAVLMPLVVFSQAASQTCQNEADIPSTTPTARFKNNGDGTVMDKITGLMWARCPEGLTGLNCKGDTTRYTWEGALNRAQESNLAGYTDWRLPNIKELSSIVEERCYSPAINLDMFPYDPNTMAYFSPYVRFFWSATPCSSTPSSGAGVVSFSEGYADCTDMRTYEVHVRLVRSGQ